MRKWIKATKKNIGRHKVGVPFQAMRRDARIFAALGLAEECDPPGKPEPEEKRSRPAKTKRTYRRRDVRPSVRAVMTADDNTE